MVGEQVVPEGKIHILYGGLSFCRTYPREWPGGDSWVRVEEAELGTCPECVKNFAEHWRPPGRH
jgi:hypothetical protein